MKLYTFIILLGVLVYVTPFLGIPEDMRAYLLFVAGFCIVVSGFVVRYRQKKYEQSPEDITYVETIPENIDQRV